MKKTQENNTRSLTVAVTGASGSLLAFSFLNTLLEFTDLNIDLVFSDTAEKVWQHELTTEIPEANRISRYVNTSFFAPIASGSHLSCGMVIIPCSMGTLARIAHGTADTLITRSADVTLKERRPLILATRETPLNAIHIRNMGLVTEAGAIVMPPLITLYNGNQNAQTMADAFSHHVLELLSIPAPRWRWGSDVYPI